MKRSIRTVGSAALFIIATGALAACGNNSSSSTTPSTASKTNHATGFTASLFVNGVGLTHKIAGGVVRPMIGPDDMAYLGGHIFVGFQNGVGSMGEGSPLGSRDSTIVEFDMQGHKLAQWDVVGKNDGLGADPSTNQIIATVNEDGNSSVYTIDPTASSTPVHYTYSGTLPHGGGTDDIAVRNGTVLISASAPSAKNGPAVYAVTFNSGTHVASFHGVFADNAKATVANSNGSSSGKAEKLALTDPDSSEIVPASASRFGGDYLLDSQGDLEQIFVQNPGASNQSLSVLKLSASVDDAAWVSSPSGAIYATDNVADAIYKITGPFVAGSELVAVTPCNANNAPATCPGPGFTQNYLGEVNPQTGSVTQIAVHGAAIAPKGMLFLP
jgi:hypothetical protein